MPLSRQAEEEKAYELKGIHQETTMNDRDNPDAHCVARARNLIARAAKRVEHLENVSTNAFCRLTALAGMLTRLEKLATSSEPDAIDAALLDAAMVCREAEILLRYIDSRLIGSAQVAVTGRTQACSPALLRGGLASGG
jgi:hypothetical protein